MATCAIPPAIAAHTAPPTAIARSLAANVMRQSPNVSSVFATVTAVEAYALRVVFASSQSMREATSKSRSYVFVAQRTKDA